MRSIRVFVISVILLIWNAAGAAQLRQIAILDVPGHPGFDAMAFAGPNLVIAHAGAGTVDIFDPAKRRLIAQVKGMADPHGIAVDEQGGRVFVAIGVNLVDVAPRRFGRHFRLQRLLDHPKARG